jgi:hypothetical protein
MKNQVVTKYAKDEYINPKIHEKTPQEMLNPRVASNCEVNRTHVFRVKRQTVAIVFVPGVMGSRLEVEQAFLSSKREDSRLWDPDDLKMMVATFFSATPEKRYELFFDQPRKVITTANDDHRRNSKAEEQGWPGVAWSCYGELITSLHDWDTPLKTLLDLPVYAFGYDWVDSNELSGFLLRQFILQRVKADKVIIVTHSMGGLVGRYALAGEGGHALADKVLGVIHGAQPVHGAPDAYHRQIAGTGAENLIGKVASRVMGASGEHMTAIAPHSPGILQLLPNQFYHTNRGGQAWLHIQNLDNEHEFQSYPQADPYEEIYLRSHHREYWGLIHGEWFQPIPESPQDVVNKLHEPDSDTELPDKDLSVTGEMKKHLSKARDFHTTIAHYSHPRTVQLFSSGGHTTITEVCWRARDITPAVSAAIPQQRHYNTHLSHYASQTSLHTRSFLGEIEEAKPQGFGEYSEIRWRHANGELGEIVPPETRLEDLRAPLTTGGMRLFQVWMTASDETVPGITDDAMCHLGDGTVPVSSATAMNPDLDAWTPCIQELPTWQTPSGELKYVTGLANQASHDQFYNDEAAIRAVKQSIFNMCLGWIKGDFE